ncbi:hypothetical protein ABW20_dc0108614 [Dactylellina cionopaga]|nr:hypothetical protein ABW20_dc0108614 [Dactylellina cionopaga]
MHNENRKAPPSAQETIHLWKILPLVSAKLDEAIKSLQEEGKIVVQFLRSKNRGNEAYLLRKLCYNGVSYDPAAISDSWGSTDEKDNLSNLDKDAGLQFRFFSGALALESPVLLSKIEETDVDYLYKTTKRVADKYFGGFEISFDCPIRPTRLCTVLQSPFDKIDPLYHRYALWKGHDSNKLREFIAASKKWGVCEDLNLKRQTLLHIAVRRRDLNLVNEISSIMRIRGSKLDPDIILRTICLSGETPLHLAIDLCVPPANPSIMVSIAKAIIYLHENLRVQDSIVHRPTAGDTKLLWLGLLLQQTRKMQRYYESSQYHELREAGLGAMRYPYPEKVPFKSLMLAIAKCPDNIKIFFNANQQNRWLSPTDSLLADVIYGPLAHTPPFERIYFGPIHVAAIFQKYDLLGYLLGSSKNHEEATLNIWSVVGIAVFTKNTNLFDSLIALELSRNYVREILEFIHKYCGQHTELKTIWSQKVMRNFGIDLPTSSYHVPISGNEKVEQYLSGNETDLPRQWYPAIDTLPEPGNNQLQKEDACGERHQDAMDIAPEYPGNIITDPDLFEEFIDYSGGSKDPIEEILDPPTYSR